MLEPEFVNYKEAARRLEGIGECFESGKLSRLTPDEWYPAFLLELLVSAQRDTLYRANDEHISCPVPWSAETGFPSHPTMIADAGQFAKLSDCPEFQKPLINSFVSWTLFSGETVSCCCGRGLREIAAEIVLNNVLGAADGGLLIKQFIGIRSDDVNHLRGHYGESSRQSKASGNIWVVYEAESIAETGGKTTVIKKNLSKYFNFERLVAVLKEQKEGQRCRN